MSPVPCLVSCRASTGALGRRRAGPEVGEDLVDHRRLRDERDEAHDAVAGGIREGVDLEELLEQRRRRAFAHRRLASVGASRGAGTMAGGPSAAAGAALSRMSSPSARASRVTSMSSHDRPSAGA